MFECIIQRQKHSQGFATYPMNLCIFHLLMNPQKILPKLELNLCSEKTFCWKNNLKLDRLLPSGYWKVPTSYLSKLFFIILGSKVFPVLDAPSNKNPRFGVGGGGWGRGIINKHFFNCNTIRICNASKKVSWYPQTTIITIIEINISKFLNKWSFFILICFCQLSQYLKCRNWEVYDTQIWKVFC